MLDSCENSRTDLHAAAFSYRDWGWSVIPIRGNSDPRNPKAAAVSWTTYQRRLPTSDEIDSWFGHGRFSGLAVVCGRVSRLAVLDIDDPECATAFADSLPDLADTFTVESGVRGLPHYYFEVPENVQLRSQRVSGADFQFDGTYVVASPTAVAGTEWRVVNEVAPYVLSQADVSRIMRFLTAWQYVNQSQREAPERVVGLGSTGSYLDEVVSSLRSTRGRLSADVLVGWYRRLAKSGRNNALFRVTCLARDHGWTRGEIQTLLLDVHVVQPPTNPHQVETPDQRRHEGRQTIQSAFRYSTRPSSYGKQQLRGLPNVVREALLQGKQSAVARVLDGLRLAGIDAGRLITERVACQALKVFNIGRRTVQAALKAVSETGKTIFESPQTPRNTNAGAAIAEEKEQKKCLFVTGAKRVKSGRPARQYLIPDNQKLYKIFDARPSGSDTIAAADLRSPDAYRQALQRELIARRPGLYSRAWLSKRLGISVWTCRRYDRHIGLQTTATYFSKRISWHDVEALPATVSQKEGIFLETPDGKRYPPVRGLAKRLLQKHPYLIQKRQHWNYYTLESEDNENNYDCQADSAGMSNCEIIHNNVPVSKPTPEREVARQPRAPDAAPQIAAVTVENEAPKLWVCKDCMKQQFNQTHPGACPRCAGDLWEVATEDVWRDPEQCGIWWRGLWQQHKRRRQPVKMAQRPGLTEAQQSAVETLYQRVREKTPSRALTYSAARQLVLDCGEVAIERALALLAERRNIYNAAGFILTVLRGTTGQAARQAASHDTPSHEDWVAKVTQSPYAAFYANDV